MRYRRRRITNTPAQKAVREELERAELWVNIVACGVAEQLKRGHYCHEGLRTLMTVMNTALDSAVTGLENANKAHDVAFNRGDSRVILTRRYRKPKATKGKKAANKKKGNQQKES